MRTIDPANARALVLYANYTSRLSYYDDWLDAFEQHPGLRVAKVDICRRGASRLIRQNLKEVDFIVLLHSTNSDTTMYLDPLVPFLNERDVPLVAFVGNEVNIESSPISDKRAVLGKIHPEYIATQLLLEAGEYLWGDLVTRAVLPVPHALNPKAFAPLVTHSKRTIDVGVRSVRYQPSIGDTDRNDLYDLFLSPWVAGSLKVDISTERLNREKWAEFLNNCRATVSSEAGSWYLERDDATVNEIQEFLRQKSGRKLVLPSDGLVRRVGHLLPWQVRILARRLLSCGPIILDASLGRGSADEEIIGRFYDRPRPPFYGKCISSRHFDAIGTGTVQVLLAGRYNNILSPDEDYIELKEDYSNLREVISSTEDVSLREEITTHVREKVLESHCHRNRVQEMLAILNLRQC